MSTHCLTIFLDEHEEEIAVLYRHMDGYPEWHGAALKAFLKDMSVVNGYRLDDSRRVANGMPCLAAQVIAYFKWGVGDFYLYPAGTRDHGEAYVYYLKADPAGVILLSCVDVFGSRVLYNGPIAHFDPTCRPEG